MARRNIFMRSRARARATPAGPVPITGSGVSISFMRNTCRHNNNNSRRSTGRDTVIDFGTGISFEIVVRRTTRPNSKLRRMIANRKVLLTENYFYYRVHNNNLFFTNEFLRFSRVLCTDRESAGQVMLTLLTYICFWAVIFS